VSIPADSAKLLLPDNAYNWSGSTQATHIERNTEENWELCEGQRTGKIHSLYTDKEAWHREKLRVGSKPEVVEDEDKALTNYPTEENLRKFIHDIFKIDENWISNRDEKPNERVRELQITYATDSEENPTEITLGRRLNLPDTCL